MSSIFYSLLDNTMAEVCRREPAYPSSFPITVPYERMVSVYRRHPLCIGLPEGALERGLSAGMDYVATGWSRVKPSDGAADPVARFLCDCIVDAYCADQGLIPLQPHSGFSGSIGEVLAQQYSKQESRAGVSYYARNSGRRPLLLINATGAPIAVWRQFLADPVHDYRVLLPQRRGSHLLRGGLQEHVDISTDSNDLISILDAESVEKVDVLAWCNGARVGLDLASKWAARISSLVLLGPMLKGIRGVAPSPSNFERDLQPLLDAVSKESSLAPFMTQLIAKQPTSPDWGRWVNDPKNRAQALFAMPAKEHAGAMIAMLTDPQSFINIARRVASDESYPMNAALENLHTRTMVIMGSDDSIVSNELVCSAIKQMCRNKITKVLLGGSGHYIHDLQYHYFRWLLNEFYDNPQSFPPTARVSVESLSGQPEETGCPAEAREDVCSKRA